MNVLKKGFTLIELLTVIAIMAIVSSVVIFNYSKFRSDTLVTNYAYEVAFALREAQIYGLSVVNSNVGSNNNFRLGYGIHLDSNATTIGATGAAYFTLFGDLPLTTTPPTLIGDRRFTNGTCTAPYTGGSCTEWVKNFSFVGKYKVKSFCVMGTSGLRCSDSGHAGASGVISSLDVTFLRPDPDAYIVANTDAVTDGSGPILSSPNTSATITIVSPLGATKEILVYSTGQISIQNTPVTP